MSHQSDSHRYIFFHYLSWTPPRLTISHLRSYGTKPLVKDQPSTKPSSDEEAAEADRKHKPILKNTKVRKVIACGECHKPRCIYAAARLAREQDVFVQVVVESGIYTCA